MYFQQYQMRFSEGVQDIIEQSDIDTPFPHIRQPFSGNRPYVFESPLTCSSLNRLYRQWVYVHRIYKTLRTSQPGCRKRKATRPTTKIKNSHPRLYTYLLKYPDGRTEPVSETKPHRHQAEVKIALVVLKLQLSYSRRPRRRAVSSLISSCQPLRVVWM